MTTLEFELSDERLADLEQLQSDCGFYDRKTLFNNALTMLQWAVVKLKEGKSIVAVDEVAERYHELEMPFMANLKP
jgi:hypothetical protein